VNLVVLDQFAEAQNEQHKGTAVKIIPLARKPAEPLLLVNVPKLVTAYYTDVPEHTLRPQLYRGAPG
jgi:phosphoglucomutase